MNLLDKVSALENEAAEFGFVSGSPPRLAPHSTRPLARILPPVHVQARPQSKLIVGDLEKGARQLGGAAVDSMCRVGDAGAMSGRSPV